MPASSEPSSATVRLARLRQRLPRAMRDDAGKTLMLAVLVVALGGMWFRMFSGGAGAARRAAGSPLAQRRGSDIRDATGRHIRSAESGDELSKWLDAEIPLVISRNLFSVNLDYYPVDGTRPTQPSRTGATETFWDQLAKSLSTQADQQEKRANLIQNLRQQAGQLQIASTFMGDGANGGRPKALIEGVLVGEGEVVAGFRVLKIEPRRVILEREGIRLEVPMK